MRCCCLRVFGVLGNVRYIFLFFPPSRHPFALLSSPPSLPYLFPRVRTTGRSSRQRRVRLSPLSESQVRRLAESVRRNTILKKRKVTIAALKPELRKVSTISFYWYSRFPF